MLNLLIATAALTAELPVDKAAHFGVSWAINHTAYTICEGITGRKGECLAVAALGTLALGATKELLDGKKNSGPQHMKDMLANAAGVALSSIVISVRW